MCCKLYTSKMHVKVYICILNIYTSIYIYIYIYRYTYTLKTHIYIYLV